MDDICAALHQLLARQLRCCFPYAAEAIPPDGVYILFEKGETAHGAERIVRVGTHNAEGMLRSRLDEHFIRENKDRSVFRKNIGRALLNRQGAPFLKQWNIDRTSVRVREDPARQVDTRRLQQVERLVTEQIRAHFTFVVLPVPRRLDRHIIEAQLIATAAQCGACRPSEAWLGLSSTNATIRASGLWQVQHLDAQPLTIEQIVLLGKLFAGQPIDSWPSVQTDSNSTGAENGD